METIDANTVFDTFVCDNNGVGSKTSSSALFENKTNEDESGNVKNMAHSATNTMIAMNGNASQNNNNNNASSFNGGGGSNNTNTNFGQLEQNRGVYHSKFFCQLSNNVVENPSILNNSCEIRQFKQNLSNQLTKLKEAVTRKLSLGSSESLDQHKLDQGLCSEHQHL